MSRLKGSNNVIIYGGTFRNLQPEDDYSAKDIETSFWHGSLGYSPCLIHPPSTTSEVKSLETVGEIKEVEEIKGAQDVQSQRIVVDESPEGFEASDEIKEGSQIEEIEGAQDILADDDDGPRTYQFDHCQVYINSFNNRGVKITKSGNHSPLYTRLFRSLAILIQLSMTYPYC